MHGKNINFLSLEEFKLRKQIKILLHKEETQSSFFFPGRNSPTRVRAALFFDVSKSQTMTHQNL
jgi:hypothetical protein